MFENVEFSKKWYCIYHELRTLSGISMVLLWSKGSWTCIHIYLMGISRGLGSDGFCLNLHRAESIFINCLLLLRWQMIVSKSSIQTLKPHFHAQLVKQDLPNSRLGIKKLWNSPCGRHAIQEKHVSGILGKHFISVTEKHFQLILQKLS